MTDFNREYSMTIDGAAVDNSSKIDVFNPATKSVIARVPDASERQLNEAVASARRAFMEYTNWRTITLNRKVGFGRDSIGRAA